MNNELEAEIESLYERDPDSDGWIIPTASIVALIARKQTEARIDELKKLPKAGHDCALDRRVESNLGLLKALSKEEE